MVGRESPDTHKPPLFFISLPPLYIYIYIIYVFVYLFEVNMVRISKFIRIEDHLLGLSVVEDKLIIIFSSDRHL